MDQFHEHRVYQVMENQQYAAEIMTTRSTPGLLSEAMLDEFPEVQYATTTTWVSPFTLSIGEHNVKAEGYYVGPQYFNIFSFPLLHGDVDKVLSDKKNIVISRSLAKKLFNEENVVGKVVEFQHEREYVISGVFEDLPGKASVQFDFVLSFEAFKDENPWVLNWGSNGPSTYLRLQDGVNVAEFNTKIAEFIKTKNEETNVTLFVKPFSELYLYGRYENGKQAGGRIEYVRLFSIIAVFILVIACINFMNLSTARASRRVKEVGIKKAIGAKQGSLVFQFLAESVLMSFIAMLVALAIVWSLLPQFNLITDKHITLLFDRQLILALLAIGGITGLLAGSYPALYLSGFRPVKILKGEVRGSIGELWARKGLVIFQFTLSVILIVSVLVIYKQIEYVQNKNLGYNKDNVLYFEIVGNIEDNLETFLSEVRRIPGVVNASSMGHDMIGRQNNTSGLNWEGKNPEDQILFENMRANYGLIETLGIKIKEGRSFDKAYSTDTAKIILNQKAVEIMGFDEPIGQVITLWDQYKLEIIGVTENFHFQSLHEQIKPVFFTIRPEQNWNVMVRIEAGREKETIASLQDFYQSFNPGFSFDYKFLDDEYQQQYAAEQRVATLSRYFAGFAIIISCLGLFGLATFTAERRIKEIGIRKALGASVSGIVYLLSADFTKLVITAIVLALPISYYLVSQWLDRFAFRIDLQVWFFVSAGIIALIIAWMAVGSQAIKAAKVNPARCLKDE